MLLPIFSIAVLHQLRYTSLNSRIGCMDSKWRWSIFCFYVTLMCEVAIIGGMVFKRWNNREQAFFFSVQDLHFLKAKSIEPKMKSHINHNRRIQVEELTTASNNQQIGQCIKFYALKK